MRKKILHPLCRNDPFVIFRGLGEDDFKKICDTIPLKRDQPTENTFDWFYSISNILTVATIH
jgi:hypothetical protein